MRDPRLVLDTLSVQSKSNENYVFERLYRNLYNEEFFLLAYSRIYSKTGNMTSGIDGKTIDGVSLERIRNIICQLKDESYQPKPVKRTYIPKKNSNKKRPLGIPSFDDKLVQEVARLILEAIFEPNFSDKSHGFRPNKSCHTALAQAKIIFNGAKWWVEGDIKGFFDNIDHQTIILILRKRIKDEKFVNLIWKFLKAGYLENWSFHKTYSGTPQGGIISPILANIYLNELDKFMEEFKAKFDTGKGRTENKEYRQYISKISNLEKKMRKNWSKYTKEQKDEAINLKKKLIKERSQLQPKEQMDESYKRIQYIRYADDFLIGIIGSKEDAEKIKGDISDFLKENLKLELSQEKTLVTNSRDKAKFLGYEISVLRTQDNVKSKNKDSKKKGRLLYHKVMLYMPSDAWFNKAKNLNVIEFDSEGKWKPSHRNELIKLDDLEILDTYNSEIRGLYNYYQLAINVSTLNSFMFFMRYSLFKTFAAKYRSTVPKVIKKYCLNKQTNQFNVKYKTKDGNKIRFLYNEGFKYVSHDNIKPEVDIVPNTLIYAGRNSTVRRLLAEKCEHCGITNVPLEMHHVRKLKDLKGKKMWEQNMIARKRKTLALCKKCHVDLHAGKLD